MNQIICEPGTSCQMTTYVIRQEWQKGYKIWMETVFTSQSECEADNMYDYYIKKWPEEYFEFLRIEHKESCLNVHNADDEQCHLS